MIRFLADLSRSSNSLNSDTSQNLSGTSDDPKIAKILENFGYAQKNISKSTNFFVIVLYFTKRICLQIETELKVEQN